MHWTVFFFSTHVHICISTAKGCKYKNNNKKKGSSAMECSIDDALLHNQMDYLWFLFMCKYTPGVRQQDCAGCVYQALFFFLFLFVMQPVTPEGDPALYITAAKWYLVRGKHVHPWETFPALWWIDDQACRCNLYNGGCPFDNPRWCCYTWPFNPAQVLWIGTLVRGLSSELFCISPSTS